eukprot:CAMPEP_0206216738 /NCGR_PEP_ID=MMETSP0047_2-20121206/2883_1 /ASSEMBLY_ACC=CAM_ASM_000192 /TAXON_ID=195065 /ORGANISM="Chroomonas mesostigmatica_cf, Strain CCMP1168" /LENGTH=83 /DNA_ID=CAMNT_0053639109 /DNA_START=273 /DNA_END=520 /DNA_ORIENTATION=+
MVKGVSGAHVTTVYNQVANDRKRARPTTFERKQTLHDLEDKDTQQGPLRKVDSIGLGTSYGVRMNDDLMHEGFEQGDMMGTSA